jgi:hypothetical protein
MRKYQQIVNLLENLKLKGMIPNLDSEITKGRRKEDILFEFFGPSFKDRNRLPDRKKTRSGIW